MPETSHLAAARDLVSRGFSVFPLRPNDKRPAIENWQNLATTDLKQIEAWWTAEPAANIGIPTSTLFVADVDPRNGGAGTLKMLEMAEEFPPSAGSLTQSGGLHLIYRLPEHTVVKGGNGKLGKGIDVKSWGGYIVAPGSEIDGKPYKWLNNLPPCLPPQWMLDLCTAARPKGEKAGQRLMAEDDKGVELAQAWLAKHAPEAAEGERDDVGFKVAARFYDYGVSKQTAHELLTEWSDTKCYPPMHPEDIARLADSASRNRSNAVGSAHPDAPGFEAVEIEPRTPTIAIPAGTTMGVTIPAHEAAARALTNPARPLIKGLLDRGTLSVLYGAPGGGKSFGAMDIGYHVGKGEAWAGMKTHRGAVIYVAAEGGEGIFSRLAALEKHYGRLHESALHILPHGLDLVHGPKDAEVLLAEMKRLEAAHGIKVELVIIDTIARVLAGGDENSGMDMGALIKNLDRIRVAGATHVMGIHHTGKDKTRGARGHSSLLGAVDTEIEVDNHVLTVTKQRDMGKETRVAFNLKPIRIGLDSDGDEVVSCYVELKQRGDLSVPLSASAQSLLDAILDGMDDEKRDESVVFDMAFVVDCVANSDSVLSPEPKALRHHMTELTDQGSVKKVKRGQWVMSKDRRTEKDNN